MVAKKLHKLFTFCNKGKRISNTQRHLSPTISNREMSEMSDENEVIRNVEFEDDILEGNLKMNEEERLPQNSKIILENLCDKLFYESEGSRISEKDSFKDLSSSFPNIRFDDRTIQKVSPKWIEAHDNLYFIVENIPPYFDGDQFSKVLEIMEELIKAKPLGNGYIVIGDAVDLCLKSKILKDTLSAKKIKRLPQNSKIILENLCYKLFYESEGSRISGKDSFEDLTSSFPNIEFDDRTIHSDWIEAHNNLYFIVKNIPPYFDESPFSKVLEIMEELIKAKSLESSYTLISVVRNILGLCMNSKILKDTLSANKIDIKTFKYVENTKTNVEAKLNEYLNRAVSFKQLHYENSIASKIDDLIAQLNRSAKTHELDKEGDRCEKSFIALVAPSLAGKTQLSFILKHRSLYFALSQFYKYAESESIQDIYLNYESLNEMIFNCSKKDIETIKNFLSENDIMTSFNVDDKFYECLAAGFITINMANEEFMVLGLLLALVEEAERTFDTIDDNLRPAWMYHHAKRHDLVIKGASINEIRNLLPKFTRYFVFLDEFTESVNNVFIRNIVRAAGLTCFVANTNTVVANLVSKKLTFFSRGQESSVWSYVINDLDSVSFKVLDSTTTISENLTILARKLSEVEGKIFLLFFEQFISNNFHHIRPGMGEFIDVVIEELSRFDYFEEVRAGDLIDLLFQKLFAYLIVRKPSIEASLDGKIANFAIHSSVGFENRLSHRTYFNMKTFLRDHLFYILNPVDASSWMFKLLTNPSKESPLKIRWQYEGINNYAKWIEVSQFKKKEIFTAMVCMFGGIKLPVARLMLNSAIRDIATASTANFPNPKQKSSSGLNFEVMATISIVDSSHYTCFRHRDDPNDVESKASLKGVDLKTFLRIILRNVLEFDCDDLAKKRWIDLDIPVDLEKSIEDFHVPFLYSSNMEWPSILNQLFPLEDSRSSIKLGTFERTSNCTQIDGRFDVLKIPQRIGFAAHMTMRAFTNRKEHIQTCQSPEQIPIRFQLKKFDFLLECKDRSENLTAEEICKILEKFLLWKNSKFGFIFCNQLGGFRRGILKPSDVKIKELLDFLSDKRINLYRIDNASNDNSIVSNAAKFKVSPFRAEVRSFPNPRLIVFILPCGTLNSPPNRQSNKRKYTQSQ